MALVSRETKQSCLSLGKAKSARVYTCMYVCLFFFTACTVCVRVLSFRKDKPLNISTNNKNSVSLHTSPEISFFPIHSIRRERQRTRWPCLLSASVQRFLFLFFLHSVASLYRKCQSSSNPERANVRLLVLLNEQETNMALNSRGITQT